MICDVAAMDKTFKIVQTTENGVLSLTAVPASWEKNGTLYWPPKKFEKAALKNAMMPEAEGWTEYECVLKREKIPTYRNALEKLCAMCDNSDTDTPNDRPKRQQKSATNNGDRSRVDRNIEFVRITSKLCAKSRQQKLKIEYYVHFR